MDFFYTILLLLRLRPFYISFFAFEFKLFFFVFSIIRLDFWLSIVKWFIYLMTNHDVYTLKLPTWWVTENTLDCVTWLRNCLIKSKSIDLSIHLFSEIDRMGHLLNDCPSIFGCSNIRIDGIIHIILSNNRRYHLWR